MNFKKPVVFLFVVLNGMFSLTNAADMPQPSRYDPRIQYTTYNAGDVVLVRTLPGIVTRLVFDPTEVILDVASGFTQGWEFSDRRNILYIKPRSIETQDLSISPTAKTWDTNLLVTTNQRLYDLDLVLLASNSAEVPRDKPVAYRVEFRYANESADADTARERAILNERLSRGPIPTNYQYSMQIGENSEHIAPTMAYDDGRFTYLRFPNNRDFPAAFLVSPVDKSESLINSHVENDTLVLQRVTKQLVLRLGDAVVGIYNNNFDMDGLPPVDGTTSPGVQREIIGE